MSIEIEAGRDVKVGGNVTACSTKEAQEVPPEKPVERKKRKPLPWRAILSAVMAFVTFLLRQLKVK